MDGVVVLTDDVTFGVSYFWSGATFGVTNVSFCWRNLGGEGGSALGGDSLLCQSKGGEGGHRRTVAAVNRAALLGIMGSLTCTARRENVPPNSFWLRRQPT